MLQNVLCMLTLGVSLGGCVVKSVCYQDDDCPGGQSCRMESGQCVDAALPADARGDVVPRDGAPDSDGSISDGDTGAGVECPDDMVAIGTDYCIDRYEASRVNATSTDVGDDASRATSRAEVLPWLVDSNAEAQAACEAAGKDLCTAAQWELACSGEANRVYAYGNDYDPLICNGIDTFCYCESGGCTGQSPCPYAGCYHDCGAAFTVLPTGQRADCHNGRGVFDLNGNVWEHVKGGSDRTVRGGAYNCSDSQTYHRCDYIPTVWNPAALGFRCCSQPARDR